MQMAYSLDLRERVIDAVAAEPSRRAAVELFELRPSVVGLWVQSRETASNIAAKPTGGCASPLEDHASFLIDLVGNQPDVMLDGFRRSDDQSDNISQPKRREPLLRTTWRRLQKRMLYGAEQKRADAVGVRRRWIRRRRMFDPMRLAFIDETVTSNPMVRSRGDSTRGERLVGYPLHGHRKPVSIVAGPRLLRITAPFVLDGAMYESMFLSYVSQDSISILKQGDVVVIDGLPAHEATRVWEPIDAATSHLTYRPPYSPNLNLITTTLAKLTETLRNGAERTVSCLVRRISCFARVFSQGQCRNVLRHAGYSPTSPASATDLDAAASRAVVTIWFARSFVRAMSDSLMRTSPRRTLIKTFHRRWWNLHCVGDHRNVRQ